MSCLYYSFKISSTSFPMREVHSYLPVFFPVLSRGSQTLKLTPHSLIAFTRSLRWFEEGLPRSSLTIMWMRLQSNTSMILRRRCSSSRTTWSVSISSRGGNLNEAVPLLAWMVAIWNTFAESEASEPRLGYLPEGVSYHAYSERKLTVYYIVTFRTDMSYRRSDGMWHLKKT